MSGHVTMPEDVWIAEPVPPERRHEVYKEQSSFAALQRRTERRSLHLAWAMAGLSGTGCLVLAITLGVVVHRQKPPEPIYIFASAPASQTVVAVNAREAVKFFGPKDAMDDIVKYATARLGYIDVLDHEQWLTVRAMSTPEQFKEYDAWRRSSLSPVKQLGTDGHVALSSWGEDQHPVQAADGVWSYSITVHSQQVKGSQIGPIETWRVSLSFRWNPDLRLSHDDVIRNQRKFQCITFEARQLS